IYMFFASDFPKPQGRILFIFAGLSGLFILPLVWPLLKAATVGNNTTFMIDPKTSVKTDMFAILIPHWYGWFKRSLYLGIVPFYLAMVAYGHRRRSARLWFILAIVAYLFAIGPVPELAGFNLGITLPWTLPIAPILRQMYRMMIIFSLGWGMIVAYGWLGFKEQLQQKNVAITPIFIIVSLVIFIDYTAVPFPTRPNIVSTFYTEYLENVSDDVALAILPTGRQQDKRYMYYQTIHKHPMTGGVISRAGEDVFRFIEENSLLRTGAVNMSPQPFPDNAEQALLQLAEANVGYLIIDKHLLNVAFREEKSLLNVEDWRQAMPVEPIFEDNLLLVFATSEDNLP
ncbi:MAG: hypothetical protein GY805_08030, partial [Chloroflexi bacterium]|nr:hypothetical protein [Chloroflexota bacterium]